MFCNLTYSMSSEKEKIFCGAICCFGGLRYDADLLMWLAAEPTDAVLTTAAIDRAPIVILGVLPRQRGTISCFTRVVVVQGETAESEIAELKKPVGQKADRGLAESRSRTPTATR